MTALRSLFVVAAVVVSVCVVGGCKQVFADTTACVGGPCGPAHQQCGPKFTKAPQFHIMDESCGENDPNGPAFVYHHFYQDHLAEPQDGHGQGPDWGHAVSRDFVHWAHLPVAIWNDQPYDEVAIFTGSTTIVDGKMVIIYPGLCVKGIEPDCDTGTLLAIAVPADPSDPLYTNWTKPSYNPIMKNTQRDPSTAWKTPAGEWRITTYDTTAYGSTDFVHWTRNGHTPGFPVGECPSFYPLPPLTPAAVERRKRLGVSKAGAAVAAATDASSTRVHKCSHGGKDWTRVGSYVAGPVGSPGNFSAAKGYPFQPILLDAGDMYASKDLWDPVKQRRINWGWARVPPASTQTLPREVTYDPDLQQLVTAPVEEQAQLRGDQLADLSTPFVVPADGTWLGNWADSAGNQSEVIVSFKRPSGAATFGVDVMVGSQGGSGGSNTSSRVYVVYTEEAAAQRAAFEAAVASGARVTADAAPVGITVGVGSAGPYLTKYMKHTDLPGADFNVTNVNYKDASTCEAVCMANDKCVAWTYVVRPPLYASCCQKHAGFGYNPSNPTCTSGVRNPGVVPSGGTTDTLQLLPSDDTIDVRVFVDNTFLEAYWQGGRVAMTKTITTPTVQAGMRVFATTSSTTSSTVPVTANSVQAWHVDSIWVTPEQVLATPPPLVPVSSHAA